MHPCVCLYVFLSLRLSLRPSLRPSVCASIRLSVSVHLCVCVCVRPSVRLSVSVCLSVCLHLKHSYRRRCRPPLSIIEMHRKGDDKTLHIRPSFEINVAQLCNALPSEKCSEGTDQPARLICACLVRVKKVFP